MISVLKWYLVSTILGICCIPITFSLFRRLPSRGYHLIRTVGSLIWGYVFWILVSLKVLTNDQAGQLFSFIILLIIGYYFSRKNKIQEIVVWLKQNHRFVIIVESLYFLAFVLFAYIRATNPEIIGTEKPMEMAFINAILRSPTFPPNDPWLSGYGISYYYFGYVLSAMFIRASGVSSGIGYNLVAAMVFGLSAINVYGLLADLLVSREHKESIKNCSTFNLRILFSALLAPLILLIVSNWHGFFDILHSRGLFWVNIPDAESSGSFWEWLNLKELTAPPVSLSWFPSRPGGVQWWGASRVLQDFRLNGEALDVIDEFPFFTFLLSDIHPHMLTMPFVLLAISQAFNAIRGGWEGETRFWKLKITLAWPEMVFAVLTLGGIAFLNTWDFPFYLVLIALAISYARLLKHGWSSSRIKEFFMLCFGLGIPAILLYFPFYLSFSSQAGGILPSLVFFTYGKYFWIMFGPLLVPILCFLFFLLYRNHSLRAIKTALFITAGGFILLFIMSWGISFVAERLPSLNQLFFALQGASPEESLLLEAVKLRIRYPGTLLTLFIFISTALTSLIAISQNKVNNDGITISFKEHENAFVLFLLLLGGLLTLAPEFLYLRDQFGTRMNTIFKFYFQTWILWSVSGSYALIYLFNFFKTNTLEDRFIPILIGLLAIVSAFLGLARDDEVFHKFNENLGVFGSELLDYLILSILALFIFWIAIELLRKNTKKVFAILSVFAIAMGLIYPVVALWNKTGGFNPTRGVTLDGTMYYRDNWPDQMMAADWLLDAPPGVLVEAVSPTGGSYTTFAAVSTFTGLPTVLGWVGHVAQWRGGYLEIGNRQDDIRVLYSTNSWEEAKAILDKYNILYVFIGDLEKRTYALNEQKFEENLVLVFETPQSKIYEVTPNY